MTERIIRASNALQRLDVLLYNTVGQTPDENAQIVLLKGMGLLNISRNLGNFYELLNKASYEAEMLRDQHRMDDYIQAIEQLHHLFIANHISSNYWRVFSDFIKDKNLLLPLNTLAKAFYERHPAIELEKDFISDLSAKFEDYQKEIIQSSISTGLKKYLLDRLEEILKILRNYIVDGTEGLEKSIKSTILDLAIKDKDFSEEDKKQPAYLNFLTFLISVGFLVKPTIYDVIGSVADINGYWKPTIENLISGQDKIAQLPKSDTNIKIVLDQATNLWCEQPHSLFKRIPKAIEPGKDSDLLPGDKAPEALPEANTSEPSMSDESSPGLETQQK
jgi:hypothetical protein